MLNIVIIHCFQILNSKTKWVDNTTDLTGKIKLDNLVGGTKYFYRVWFSNIDNRTKSLPMVGTFRTAPNSTTFRNSINFIVGADIGGQKFCRDITKDMQYLKK